MCHGLKHLDDIHVDGETIEATYNHPFWVVELMTFVWAQDLVPGEHLLLADGRAPPITAMSHHDEITTVYNLSIQSIHTFYVGHSAVLVHNECIPTSGLVKGPNGALRDPATGRFVPNPNTPAKLVRGGPHGNSLSSPRPATLYAKYNGKDVFQKYGISQDLRSRYTQEELGEGGYLRPLTEGPRAWMRQMEYQMNQIDPGPEMIRP